MRQTNSIRSADILVNDIASRIRALPTLNTENIRAVRREFSRELSKAPPEHVIQVSLRLLNRHAIESRFVAYELIRRHPAALASLREKDLKRFGNGIDSWGAVDMFGCYLAGPAWRENQVADRVIHRWARAKDRWWRRAALVSTVPLNSKAHGGRGDTARTLEVCRMLASDRDDMVVKALSWALRVLAKHDSTSVREFVAEHRDLLSARVVREVGNKLSTGLKNPRVRRSIA
ncbi:MAG: DNA alkylation repair protein [Blastocatellia bacterium]